MDAAERLRYKTLANDAIIATFGRTDLTAQLAAALESCVEEIDEANSRCPTCSVCEEHGDHESDETEVDAGEVMGVHAELKKQLAVLDRLYKQLAEGGTITADDLRDPVAELDEQIDELEACIVP